MEIVRTGICLSETGFSDAVARGLAMTGDSLELIVMNDISEYYKYDVVITDTDYDYPNIIVLTRDEDSVSVTEGPPYRIFRYKDNVGLKNDILYIYYIMTGKVAGIRNRHSVKLIVAASESGGAGCTALSISLCRSLDKIFGLRCLYLNICPINDSRKYFHDRGGDSFLKLIYYLGLGRDFPVETFIHHDDGIDYLGSLTLNRHYGDMDAEMTERFLQRVGELGNYDFIVADTGCHIAGAAVGFIGNADLMLLIRNENVKAPDGYYEYLEKEMSQMAGNAGILRIVNFASDQWHGDSEEYYITRDDNVHDYIASGGFDVDLGRNFGLEIGAVTNGVVEAVCGEGEYGSGAC